MQRRLLDALEARHTVKTLPEFGIERAAQLAGCTANHIRNLETRGDLPQPRLVDAGSIQRRIYNYNERNRLRAAIGKRPSRPAGASCVRAVSYTHLNVRRCRKKRFFPVLLPPCCHQGPSDPVSDRAGCLSPRQQLSLIHI